MELLDDGDVLQVYHLTSHPLTVLVTPQGAIYRQYLGWREKQELEQGIQAFFDLPNL